MKLNITAEELAKIIKGDFTGKQPRRVIDVISKDTRAINAGDCYWALKGSNFDGADFAAQAAAKGAALIVAPQGSVNLNCLGADLIEVPDTLAALQTLAKYHRLKHNLKVAAITGSNGKSTTKQMLLAIMSAAGKTTANIGNLNNQIGVPLSLLEITERDDYGVFELGASKRGDIDEIASLALPDAAVITNVSPAHLEFFGDMENIYKTKTEIIKSLNASGALVYNLDNEYLRRLKTEYNGRAIAYGFSPYADLVIDDAEGKEFSFTYRGAVFRAPVVLERHNKLNAAAACGAAIALGLFKEQIEKGLASYEPMPLRLQVERRGKAVLLLDYYNANPASMESALDALLKYPAPHTAVLGDMLELGGFAEQYHAELAQKILVRGIKRALLAGPHMRAAYEILAKAGGVMVKYSVDKAGIAGDAREALSEACACGGSVLIKASRGMGFEEIYKAL
ncbi:MAG: UDP-N-acetylmuramoyl-tripeptide--D-alanyl-D-alanine ligase [Elusimicrobiota bacterium]|jgi:UDP-N-acetylmuramoyl-tripeptide--D-alanyl-D-alanine ligase|nr:UDP-N-acetylmuramoyl-tripeptide--D-alanyl-D-alanine ligase [Elusimicrobiota bacterium]